MTPLFYPPANPPLTQSHHEIEETKGWCNGRGAGGAANPHLGNGNGDRESLPRTNLRTGHRVLLLRTQIPNPQSIGGLETASHLDGGSSNAHPQ